MDDQLQDVTNLYERLIDAWNRRDAAGMSVGERIKTAELLNQSDVAVIQHEYGIYGGPDGDEVVQIMAGLRVPAIVIRLQRSAVAP